MKTHNFYFIIIYLHNSPLNFELKNDPDMISLDSFNKIKQDPYNRGVLLF